MKTGVVTFIVMLFLSASANAQAPTAGELAVQRELIELRAELKSLRTDIQTLVQSLKPAAPQSATTPVTQPLAEPSAPLLAAAPDKMYLPSRAQNPNREPRLEIEERPFVELTLDQCIEMALHHVSRSAKPEANASSKAQITYDTKVAFWQLWRGHREWESSMQQHISALSLFENCRSDEHSAQELLQQLQAWVNDTSPSAPSHRFGNDKNIGTTIWTLENHLRKRIGWAQASSEQPNIKPSVARVELAQWPDSWDSTLCRALECNPELQSVREELSAMKGQVAQLKGQPGYDKLAWESVKLAERERQQTLSLQNELMYAWRHQDSQREQARIFREQVLANNEEVRIYRERLLEAAGNQIVTIDQLRRASERLGSVTFQYWMSVAEYQKVYAQLETLAP